jgi:hypothetical protein
MQRDDGTRNSSGVEDPRGEVSRYFAGIVRFRHSCAQDDGSLLCYADRLIEARLATICRVGTNDAALSRFVDRRNERANFIGVRRWRGADSLLQISNVRLNASISDCSPLCLAGTLGS